ncbi:hypothetical protein VOLCADRAFT_106282 [Volvox carteri f. nagariensis]|uniref:Pherophorin domain-containing protein n=1 Tax=Volvox carteri f. nagariensis TaxID=3068 RepID=D8U6C0_VOLCA|nr:uncharacterized protein VOLCADRAFT_106282 [Volvox carteri f. nagariensis]EFJ44688.1 hypothetical protein VOLCADRAFT_106282 [Volvox carteri f. nagariensis]|eukprot:XP_002954264.1 hypothetical protein VOLCADRAFT_106282 [Volvox carteri f. nagariensis]
MSFAPFMRQRQQQPQVQPQAQGVRRRLVGVINTLGGMRLAPGEWLLDIGAEDHLTFTPEDVEGLKPVREGEGVVFEVADGRTVSSIEESLSSGTDDEGPRRAPLVEIEMNPVGGPAGDEGSDDEPGPLIDDDEASDWSESDRDDDGEVDEEANFNIGCHVIFHEFVIQGNGIVCKKSLRPTWENFNETNWACRAQVLATATQTVLYPNFPFFQCSRGTSPYSLTQGVTAFGNGTYCFKLNVVPVSGSTGYCATKADLRKIEINVRPSCDTDGTIVRATINGVFTAGANVLYPIAIPEGECNALAEVAVESISNVTAAMGVRFLGAPRITCAPSYISICATFFSDEDGAKLQPYIADLVNPWLGAVTGGGPACRAFLNGYTIAITVGPEGDPFNVRTDGCLFYTTSLACAAQKVDYPKCKCVTRQRATPFAAIPIIMTYPGRKNYTVLQCFKIFAVAPYSPNSDCGRTTTLRSVEFWANDDQRGRVKAIGLRAAGATEMTFVSELWGPVGDDTLKTPAFNWNMTQANGGEICLELEYITDLSRFCVYGDETCWLALFDESKDCCPLYSASVLG